WETIAVRFALAPILGVERRRPRAPWVGRVVDSPAALVIVGDGKQVALQACVVHSIDTLAVLREAKTGARWAMSTVHSPLHYQNSQAERSRRRFFGARASTIASDVS